MNTARSLGKYEIIEELGRGGFATVYRARDPDLDREVALKVLHPMLMTDPTFVERFRREARAAGRMQHPGIVTIYEIGHVEGMLYIAMELLPGPSLADILREDAPLTVEHAVKLLRPLAEALDHAHAQGLVHRDLKPSNVILNAQGQTVLTDFGLVRAAEGDAPSAVSLTLSQTGMTLGTPAYMAPEQCDPDAEGPVDNRADLYSLGVIAYEMLTGRVPFQGNTPLAVAMGHVLKDPTRPRALNRELPVEVEAALLQALAKRPEARFESAGALWSALQRTQVSATLLDDKAPRAEFLHTGVCVAEGAGVPQHTLIGHAGAVKSLVFDYSGAKLVSGSADGSIWFWQVADGSILQNLGFPPGPIHGATLSPDGEILGFLAGQSVRLWRVTDKADLQSFHSGVGRSWPGSLAFSPNGKLIALGWNCGDIGLHEVASGTRWQASSHEFRPGRQGKTVSVNALCFHPDGSILASGFSDETVRLWRVADGTPLRIMAPRMKMPASTPNPTVLVDFYPDGTLLASVTRDGAVHIWRVSDGAVHATLTDHLRLLTEEPKPECVFCSKCGRKLSLGAEECDRCGNQGQSGFPRLLAESPLPDVHLVLNSDWTTAALRSSWNPGRVLIVALSSSERLATLDHDESITSFAFSPDSMTLATGSAGGTVRLWSIPTHRGG